mmetsp:Transcript_64673/g.140868  ORF Transcript_64673/g.140868 Transcript_64673/m.140868 type:complete len:431 (+) Transcript_64673:121-1413(+)
MAQTTQEGKAPRRICIVGGVAGGASCAARLRRMDEFAKITMFERGPYVSFANCGLPYYVGEVIQKQDSLLVATPKLFLDRFDIDVRVGTEVMSFDPKAKTLVARNVTTGETTTEPYDVLVLAPGAAALKPPIPGIDLPAVFTVKTIPDTEKLKAWMEGVGAKRAVVVGGGFIGVEMMENLHGLGLHVSVLEMLPQVLPPLDRELANEVANTIRAKGVELVLGDGVQAFEPGETGKGVVVVSASGRRLPADVVILSLGVRPESGLAKAAGLSLGPRGGIIVDEYGLTSDPNVYAVGDAVEVTDIVTGDHVMVPLAAPASHAGRTVADCIAGRKTKFRGVQATAVCRVFDLTVAMTGASEKGLEMRRQRLGDDAPLHDICSEVGGAAPGPFLVEKTTKGGVGEERLAVSINNCLQYSPRRNSEFGWWRAVEG